MSLFCEPQKGSNLTGGCRHRPREDSCDLRRVHGHTGSRNHVAEVMNGRLPEYTLGEFGKQLMVTEELEDKSQVLDVVV